MLVVDNLCAHYGAIAALKDVSIRVDANEIVAIIGPNGAGKSTLLKTIVGLHRPTSGQIQFEGQVVSKDRPENIVRRGLTLVPEGRRILTTLTVQENLRLGAAARSDRAGVGSDLASVVDRFPVLGAHSGVPAGRLSGGEQQQLAIARALMSRPRLLLLDEPSLGLAPLVVKIVFETILELREQGMTVVLVEQNAVKALDCSDRAYLLVSGGVQATGTGAELTDAAELSHAYLGRSG